MVALLAAGQPVAAPPPAVIEAAESDQIVVTGYSKPYKLNGKQLATAARVFRKYRGAYAPQARLMFQVRRKTSRDLGDLRLALRSKTVDIPLTLDAQSRFVLPDVIGKDWQLVANRGSGGLKIHPLVMTSGTSIDDRLLGDMRLECEVTWAAFIKPELPFLLRAPAAAMNACHMANFGLYQNVERPIKTASVVAGGAATPIQLGKGGSSYRYPGFDKRLPNSARVRFNH